MPLSRLPQPVRKTVGPAVTTTSPTPFPQAHPRRSFLSPKELWSPTPNSPTTPKPVTKYQLQDPGAVPSRLPMHTGNSHATTRQSTGRQVPVPSGLPRPKPYIPPGLRNGHDHLLGSPVSSAATVAPASPAPKVVSLAKKTPAPSVVTQRHISHRSRSRSSSSQNEVSERERQPPVQRTSLAESRAMSPTSSTTSADMTLIWQPDPESSGHTSDPAENLWKEIELRMGNRQSSNKGKAERGQWVLTRRQCDLEGKGEAVSMEKAESEFSVSAYLHPDFDTPRQRPRPVQGSAMFDMSAPLVHSKSGDCAATPANTPCIRADTLRRAPRVAKKGSSTSTSSSSSRSSGSAYGTRSNSSDSCSAAPLSAAESGSMYKLDSHVVAALEALSLSEDESGSGGYWTSPKLDKALSASPPNHEGGLGLGLHIRHDSIYFLSDDTPLPSTPTRRRHPTTRRSVQVTDLDTGHVSLHRLDQLSQMRLG